MEVKTNGVVFTPLKKIDTENGPVLHALKSNEPTFENFGEAYFSVINFKKIKGWKKHQKMLLNLVVPLGEVLFTVYDDRPGSTTYNKYEQFIIGESNYGRLTIESGLWVAFQGLTNPISIVLNVSSILHDPSESLSKPISNELFQDVKWQ